MANNRMITLLCEGPSENAYSQELNRYLRENECKLVLIPSKHPIGTGFYSTVYPRYRKEREKNPRTPIKVILDDDIYVRNGNNQEKSNTAKYKDSPIKDDFLFNTHNFEDFLMLHYDDETLNQWIATCAEYNHEQVPLHSDEYIPLLQKMFPNYKKGELLFTPIDKDKLDNLFRHNEDKGIFIKSDFAAFLKKLLNDS